MKMKPNFVEENWRDEFDLLKVRAVGRRRVLNTIRLNKRNWDIEDAAFEAIYG